MTEATGTVVEAGRPIDGVGHPMIAVTDVTKRFTSRAGVAHTVLEDVSLDAGPGEFISLVGRSGCGKTTLLKIFAGLVTPTEGQLTVMGRERDRPEPSFVGFVPQAPALLPWRTVLRNVLLPVQVLGGDLRSARQRAVALLGAMDLGDAVDKHPWELSGGMQQRVAIARALIHDPAVLFMDEPFAALDALTRDSMAGQLQRVHMQHGKTVLFVTHSIPEAVYLSDRVIVMSKDPGRVARVFPVDLPRPRQHAEVLRSDLLPEIEAALGVDAGGAG
ncbi:MAG: ABC transporter ATP-binding protein [Acidimicrobiia bacterium]